MKKLTLILGVILGLTFIQSNAQEGAKTYSVDRKGSNIEWLGEKVTGEHKGNISPKEGTVLMTDGKLTSVNLTMDMTTITCTDIEDKEYAAKLVGHLKNDDFFGVAENPTANFVSTGINVINLKEGKYTVTGDMTIKGKTNEVSFDISLIQDGNKMDAKSVIKIDRTKFDIHYGSASFFDDLKDKAILDIFTLTVKLHGMEKK
jgi:polyisoprenoid-binding protein YceI